MNDLPNTKEAAPKGNMPSVYVVDFYNRLESLGMEIRIDGGWAVDALLEKQTRPHSDLDIVIEERHLPGLRRLLESEGFKDVPRDDTSPWNFVLGDDKGHEIDVHAIVYDDNGNGIYGPAERGVMYPASALTGEGIINGQKVRCTSAGDLVKFHTGYKLREVDYKDVVALCEKFGIDYPPEYTHLKN